MLLLVNIISDVILLFIFQLNNDNCAIIENFKQMEKIIKNL